MENEESLLELVLGSYSGSEAGNWPFYKMIIKEFLESGGPVVRVMIHGRNISQVRSGLAWARDELEVRDILLLTNDGGHVVMINIEALPTVIRGY